LGILSKHWGLKVGATGLQTVAPNAIHGDSKSKTHISDDETIFVLFRIVRIWFFGQLQTASFGFAKPSNQQ
jgi:hypothetical protein